VKRDEKCQDTAIPQVIPVAPKDALCCPEHRGLIGPGPMSRLPVTSPDASMEVVRKRPSRIGPWLILALVLAAFASYALYLPLVVLVADHFKMSPASTVPAAAEVAPRPIEVERPHAAQIPPDAVLARERELEQLVQGQDAMAKQALDGVRANLRRYRERFLQITRNRRTTRGQAPVRQEPDLGAPEQERLQPQDRQAGDAWRQGPMRIQGPAVP